MTCVTNPACDSVDCTGSYLLSLRLFPCRQPPGEHHFIIISHMHTCNPGVYLTLSQGVVTVFDGLINQSVDDISISGGITISITIDRII